MWKFFESNNMETHRFIKVVYVYVTNGDCNLRVINELNSISIKLFQFDYSYLNIL